jgi:hypothetical protein
MDDTHHYLRRHHYDNEKSVTHRFETMQNYINEIDQLLEILEPVVITGNENDETVINDKIRKMDVSIWEREMGDTSNIPDFALHRHARFFLMDLDYTHYWANNIDQDNTWSKQFMKLIQKLQEDMKEHHLYLEKQYEGTGETIFIGTPDEFAWLQREWNNIAGILIDVFVFIFDLPYMPHHETDGIRNWPLSPIVEDNMNYRRHVLNNKPFMEFLKLCVWKNFRFPYELSNPYKKSHTHEYGTEFKNKISKIKPDIQTQMQEIEIDYALEKAFEWKHTSEETNRSNESSNPDFTQFKKQVNVSSLLARLGEML